MSRHNHVSKGTYLWIAGVPPGSKHVHLIHDLHDVRAKCPEDDAEIPLLHTSSEPVNVITYHEQDHIHEAMHLKTIGSEQKYCCKVVQGGTYVIGRSHTSSRRPSMTDRPSTSALERERVLGEDLRMEVLQEAKERGQDVASAPTKQVLGLAVALYSALCLVWQRQRLFQLSVYTPAHPPLPPQPKTSVPPARLQDKIQRLV